MSHSNGLILMYHHVADSRTDAGALHVSPLHFEQHVEVLRREAHPVPLKRLAAETAKGSISERSVVVTFDDGYVDNLRYAKPALERYEIPATVFVATRPAEHGSEFWWDELERLLLHPGDLPPTIELQLDGHNSLQWNLREAANYREADCLKHCKWKCWEDPPTTRHALYNALRERLVTLEPSQQQALMDRIRRWAGQNEKAPTDFLSLSTDEALELVDGGLIEIGAHTVHHPMLSLMELGTQRAEIAESKAALEALVARPVTSFAYPYGDYSEATVRLVSELGFTSACATLRGALRPYADIFRLPRVQVYDLDGDQFAKWLRDSFRLPSAAA